MTSEEFNALPLDARRYIEKEQGCQSCGGSSQDIDTIYKKYLVMSKGALFTLRTGAVNFKSADGKKTGILYPIHPNDSEEVIKEKLEAALEVHAVAPDKFDNISEEKIKKILDAKPAEDKPKAPLTGAAKKAAETKAANAALKAKAEAEAEAEEAKKAAELEAEAANSDESEEIDEELD